MALFSFIQSLNTSFGTSIFEPVAIAISQNKFAKAERGVTAGEFISSAAFEVIQDIMTELTTTGSPDKVSEIERIRAVCQTGTMTAVNPTKIDIRLTELDGSLFLFDIKTVKPNKGNFKEFKRTLLEWVATVLAEDSLATVQTLIAIPYNPYAPGPYNRWTMAGMLDLKQELKVAEEFWDFLGGQGTYVELLNCFERVGNELRTEIDAYFSKFSFN